MNQVSESIMISAPKSKVFDAFVNHIDRWWPRVGTYRYSFAQAPKKSLHIQFEAKLNGRFYEEYDDGSSYEIGRITSWQPPDRLAYTWRDPKWPASTNVTVTFVEADGITTVTVLHAGFGNAGIPDVAEGYQAGLAEILEGMQTWFCTNQLN